MAVPLRSGIQSSGAIPNPSEWLLMSDRDFDAYAGMVQADDVYQAMTHGFRCADCGRFHVFWSGLDHDPTVYAAEQ
ncbi:hypothetical protein ABN034_12725 [Actinopolymorpha sp. B11F2]|uniref:hypothetical protein n=1 Tax=Actinopolymorpha sp. B11F2 TaxID=3160862 RepID=UPI0032E38538